MGRQMILVVEDEPVNRKILKKLLAEHYDVLEAENGAVAWELLAEKRDLISAVLLDIVMPVMDGYEFLRKLQGANWGDIPVIVTTGTTDVETEQRALDSGAWDFVTKPYQAKVLFSRLRNAIARSKLAAYEKLQYLSEHDELTGLYNRGKMFAEMQKMIKTHPEESFLFLRMDIDHFALFNTSFGEQAGNELLKYTADYLSGMTLQNPLAVFGRMTADVFCLCLPETAGGSSHLERDVAALREYIAAYRTDYRLEISVGACVMDDRSLSIEEYNYRASVAAQRCKNQVDVHLAFYDKSVGQKIAEEFALTNEMETALREHQFTVYLQPKFNLSTEKACGAEALVRWIHPTRGIIPPGEFIPVFEKNGFISRLDYYVWEETCRMLHDWQQRGLHFFPVSVNISRVSLYNPQLAWLMTELVQKYTIPPAMLQLEVTESAYMSNPGLMETSIAALHNAGFTILMDDFGSGYSSLNTLKRIQVDVLKVDMQFLPVRDETERGEIILSCIIKMANWLGMSVVVEGVETRRQRDFLEGAGCDYIQGYYYSRPVPREEYEATYLTAEPEAEYPGEPARPKEVPARQKMTVMIIDDSEIDCGLLQTILQEEYDTLLCSTAEAGLACLKANSSRIRLILVDNILPGMSGLEFLRYCRHEGAFSGIPKVLVTANNTVQDQVAAFREGAYDYITKPFAAEVVQARVRHVLDLYRGNSIFDAIEVECRKQSELDIATKLLNKIAFKSIGNRVLEGMPEDREALLVLDIDDFKQINDRYGHLSGDAVLNCAAAELSSAFRKTDIIGRFGGDEFVVLMTRLPNREIARRKAAELIKGVMLRCTHSLNICVSISVGLAFFEPEDTIDSLFGRADEALYEAKNTGKGKVVVYGEKIPSIRDDNKPIVPVCSTDPQVYPAIAFAYGESAAFANITNRIELEEAFRRYGERIRAVCLDIAEGDGEGPDAFIRCLLEHGGGKSLPLLAVCRESSMQQLRSASVLPICDVITLPAQIDVIQRRLTSVLMIGELEP